jgi:AcrR family transcriptional regulator
MSKGEETRTAILDTALALASTGGLEGLSIGNLAREVGLSKSGLFAHFNSKENLQLQVLTTAAERFVAEVVTPALRRPRGEPRVRALFEHWLAWAKASYLPGGCPFVATAVELDDRPGPLRDYLVDAQSRWLGTMARAATIAVEEGHFRAGLDGEQFAYELYSILLAYHLFRRLLRDPRAEARSRSAFERLLASARVPVPTPAS